MNRKMRCMLETVTKKVTPMRYSCYLLLRRLCVMLFVYNRLNNVLLRLMGPLPTCMYPLPWLLRMQSCGFTSPP